MTTKINRALMADEIREIADECEARDMISSTPPEEWRAVAKGDDWTLCKIDSLPDFYALLTACGEPFILDREEVVAQLGEEDAIAAGYGPIKSTDAGEYTIVAHVFDDRNCDDSINLYVGKAADGHHDMIASDNASMWVVGDENDAERNRNQWDLIAARCDVAPVLDDVRKIDSDLADWLANRYDEARRADEVLRSMVEA